MLEAINKFKQLLNKQQKIRVVIIGILMVIGAFLETLGVSLILPLAQAVTMPDIIETNKYVRKVCELFDLHSAKTFIILVIAALIFLFVLKNLYLLFEYYIQYRFVYNNRFSTQQRLLSAYLKRPYEYFLNASSGEIVNNVVNDVQNAFALLTTILNFFTDAVVSAMLVIILFITDFWMAAFMATVFLVMILMIAKVVKPILWKAGLSFQKNSELSYKWLLQSISGIKELKVAQKEKFFLSQYAWYGKKSIKAERDNSIIQNIPRLLIEAVSIGGILGVIGLMLFMGREIDNMIPQITAFAYAAIRLMPSVNRISAAYNTISYQTPALDKLMKNVDLIKKWENQRNIGENKKKQSNCLKWKDKIELKDITYAYKGTDTLIFNKASMEIPIGKSVGIVGASGAGKTTAVDILLGLLELQSGHVLADGIDIQENYSRWLEKIGYIPQTIYMLDDTIKANIAFGLEQKEISENMIWKALDEASLSEFIRNLPEGIDTQIGERGVRLSGGQRQRIGIARALYHEPELLIFDEATSALDNETEGEIMQSINALHGKKTIVIIAHRLTTIENCDLVYQVRDGKIIKSTLSK